MSEGEQHRYDMLIDDGRFVCLQLISSTQCRHVEQGFH